MNRTLAILAILALAAAAAPTFAADVGVSVQISQPGVYGRIDIGRFPQPVVVAPSPVLVTPLPPPRAVVVRPEPVYLWVPPGHQRNWNRYCARYNACGVPVYFVQDRWYREHVMAERGHGHGDRDHDRDHDHGHGHWEHGDRGRHD